MHQLTQQLKSGHMEILEVPFPTLGKGQVLVRNHYSVISAGTEGKTVSDARKGYIAKAQSRQKEVKQVIELIKTNGLLETYKLVMNKLEAPAALGYSCAGEVIAIGEGVTNFKVGDFVACGGQGAYHADVVAVYSNLCVKVPDDTNLKHASLTTIAAIAIQGIRQADLRFGESCVIIGLGLIGQLTIQILNAAGIKTIGVDIDDNQVEIAKRSNPFVVLNRNQKGIEKMIFDSTNGLGADAVIITAGTSSLDPVNFAGEITRRKGKVVIVGAVPTGFDRPNYYKKELELLMSSSYGPGRYDINYEEKGIDYPAGYVRWTENRNMQSYIDLLSAGKLDVDKLISHVFALDNAPEAYNMILDKSENFSGILIEYDSGKPVKQFVKIENPTQKSTSLGVAFIGAGNFAQNMLLPKLKGMCSFTGINTAHGNTARYVADKYKFGYCTNNADEIFSDINTSTVFITTRHNLHAEFVLKALAAGKNVFVEKPLAMNIDELKQIQAVYETLPESTRPILFVGYNRRFSPFIQQIKRMFMDNQPKAMNFRINAGALPKDHWVNDPDIGGGRIVGEACHFIDLAQYVAGSSIKSLSASGIKDSNNLFDTVTITLEFENGSIANISYFSNGSKSLSKEYIEIFCGGTSAIIDDFKTMRVFSKDEKKYKLKSQDKGHAAELSAFINAVKNGQPSPIKFEELYQSSVASFMVLQSIKENRKLLF